MEPRVSANRVVVVDNSQVAELLGYNDSVIRVIEDEYPNVTILVRGNEISLHGAVRDIDEAATAVEELRAILNAGANLNAEVASEAVRMLRSGERAKAGAPAEEPSEPVTPAPKAEPAAAPTPKPAPKPASARARKSEPAPEPEVVPEPAPVPEPEPTPEPEPEVAGPAADTNVDVLEEDLPAVVPPASAGPETPAQVLSRSVLSSRGRTIRPKTEGQANYVNAIEQHTITFGIGPAGTGKTYLAMAQAVAALQAKRVNRIVLTRPAVEAGERLGFLPGSLSEKIDPYLRPLYDALHDMIDPESIPRLMEAGTIEVAPLAYMRGRTLNDAFIILDEAQNTTREQMKMFLTRLGFGATMVVTGDVTQVDLPGGTQSGLRAASEILTGVEDIAFCHLGADDVVRHRLVSDIITAYALVEEAGPANGTRRSNRTDGQQRRLKNNGDSS